MLTYIRTRQIKALTLETMIDIADQELTPHQAHQTTEKLKSKWRKNK